MKITSLTRSITILFFDKEDTINPCGSLQLMQMGTHAFIHSLIGKGFYEMLGHSGIDQLVDMGITNVYAAVSDSHLRLMQRKLRASVDVSHEGPCFVNGHRLNWVLLTKK